MKYNFLLFRRSAVLRHHEYVLVPILNTICYCVCTAFLLVAFPIVNPFHFLLSYMLVLSYILVIGVALTTIYLGFYKIFTKHGGLLAVLPLFIIVVLQFSMIGISNKADSEAAVQEIINQPFVGWTYSGMRALNEGSISSQKK